MWAGCCALQASIQVLQGAIAVMSAVFMATMYWAGELGGAPAVLQPGKLLPVQK
jgi:hypothetical protein